MWWLCLYPHRLQQVVRLWIQKKYEQLLDFFCDAIVSESLFCNRYTVFVQRVKYQPQTELQEIVVRSPPS